MNEPSTPRLGTSELVTILRQEIRKGTYYAGDRLPSERVLAATYGVARGTLRSSLARLELEGLVDIRPGSGTYVTFQDVMPAAAAVDAASPLELMDARFALEPHVCRLAVMHGRRPDFDVLEDLCQRMEQSQNSPAAFSEADAEFHRFLVETTRNGLLVWIMGQINSVRSRDEWNRMRHVTLNPGIIAQYNVQHRQILNAIRTREPERAANLMKDHLETARLSLTRAAST